MRFGKIRSWFVPVFDDEDLNRRARAIYTIAVGGTLLSLIVNGISIALLAFFPQEYGLALPLVVLLTSFVWFAAIYWLARRARLEAASHVLLWGGCMLVWGGNLLDPATGLTDPSWYLFVLVVVGATFLLGTHWGLLFAIVETLLYLAAALFKQFGPLGPPASFADAVYAVLMMGGVLHILAFLARLFSGGLEQALALAREQAAELTRYREILEQRIEMEQEQRQRLEAVNRQVEDRVRLEQEQRARLQQLADQVREAAIRLGSAASEILAATTQQAVDTSEQADIVDQVSHSVLDVKAISEQSTRQAQQVVNVSQLTIQASEAGQAAVQDVIVGMEQIKERVRSIAANVLDLSRRSRQIGRIIATVDEIAARSDILALNAEVEAVRAGEAGRGFTVVAGEVRRLAEQSQEATEQVQRLLSEIQEGVDGTVVVAKEGASVVDEETRRVEQTGTVIEQLASVITDSSELAQEVMAGGRQQALGIEQIVVAVETVHLMTAQNLASIQQMERAVQDLNDLARNLTDVVAQFEEK
ncbi:MAG: hypothetical protein JW900_03125 [Anaerolineae bacterium]|nr:hypothetical protein [Anaerolineae bacterium]